MLAPLGGWRLYVLAAIGLVIGGLGLAVYIYKTKAEAAQARYEQVEQQRDIAIAAVKRGEAESARLRELTHALNEQIVERDKRARALEDAKRNLKRELDALKETVSEADKACLDRGLPQPIVDRLRDS